MPAKNQALSSPAKPLPNSQALPAIFRRLKQILVPYARYMSVRDDTATAYTLVAPFKQNKAKRFGGVRIFRDHVTFFSCPDILQAASPPLKGQMQGTSSVNFRALNEASVRELEKLTAARFKNFQSGSW